MPFAWSVLSEDRLKYHSLVTFAAKYIYADNHGRTEHDQICSQQIDATMKNFGITVTAMTCGSLVAVFGPIFFYFTEGNKSTTIEVKVPFLDDNQNDEYLINMLLQSIVYFHGFFIYFGIEVAMSICFM